MIGCYLLEFLTFPVQFSLRVKIKGRFLRSSRTTRILLSGIFEDQLKRLMSCSYSRLIPLCFLLGTVGIRSPSLMSHRWMLCSSVIKAQIRRRALGPRTPASEKQVTSQCGMLSGAPTFSTPFPYQPLYSSTPSPFSSKGNCGPPCKRDVPFRTYEVESRAQDVTEM